MKNTEGNNRLKGMLRRAAYRLVWSRRLVFFSIMLISGLAACLVWITRTGLLPTTVSAATMPVDNKEVVLPPVVPISTVIPCNAEDFKYLPLILASIANQTALPHEVVMVVNIPRSADDGSLLMDLQSPWFNFDSFNDAGNSIDRTKHMQTVPQPLSLLEDGTFDLPTFENATHALKYIKEILPPAAESLAKIPDFKLFVRAGDHWAGNNRWWGANQTRADTELVSFFDCDDYMHPQRFEILYEAFQKHPDLEALVHGYFLIKISEWPQRILDFLGPVEADIDTFRHTYETLWDSLPVKKLKGDSTEPEQVKGGYIWWFPKDMKLPGRNGGHNGWLTLKREVLAEVPYPDTRRGQDSLYNWRLLKNKRFWNFIDVRLGGYVRFK